MTRPIGGKPESTQDRYNDVHSVGSSFGAELDEDAVRKLLGNQVENPFASIVVGLAETVTDILDSVARGIVGLFVPGAREGAIRDAIVAVMEPLESQVYDLGLNLTALSDETKILIGEQSGLVEEANAALEIVKTTLAEQAAKNEEFQSELATAREETSEAITKSSEAVSLANSINAALTKQITSAFNEAIAKAEEGISKAESANADLINLNANLGEITEQASELNNQLSAQNEKFTNGLANANTAIGEAKDAAAAVKKIADQNKKDVASAIAKADAANAELAELTPKVSDAVAKANKASSDVSTLTPKVTAASADAAKASQDVAALTPKVTDAVSKSEKATSDVAALTSDVEVTQATADKALADLKNLSVGGRNLLRRIDPVRSNTYQQVEDTGEVFWTGEPIYKGTKLTSGTPPTQVNSSITFEPGDEYTASIWVKGEGLENSRMTASFLLYSGQAWGSGYSEGDGTQWTRIVATWKNDTPDPVLIRFYFYLNRKPGEITYFTSPQVERGNVATDWTPPIEDFTAEFSDIRKDLNQKHTEAMDKAGIAVDALPGINDQLAEIGTKADQGIADAKAVNDKLPAITQKVTDLTTEQGNLADGLSQAATQEDYNSLNTAFQQEQVKINNLNTAFQEEQTKLNTLTSDFQMYQSDLNLKQQDWNLGAQRALTALEDVAAVQKEVNSNNEAFQNFQLDVNENRAKWEQGATLAIDNLTDFSAKQTKWNKASADATQALSDAAKAQADVNAEQEKFNNFQTQFNQDQVAWNEAVDRSIATQNTVNENFEKWTEGATTAIQANTDATEALARINGIQVGGRNYFLNSGGVGAPLTLNSNNGSIYPITRGEDEHGAWLQGAYADGSGWILSTYVNPLFESGYGTYYSPDFRSDKVPYTQSVEVMCMETVWASIGAGTRVALEPGVWTRIHRTLTRDDLTRPQGINASPIGDIPESTRLYHRRWKLEMGNRVTDWTPAIEDLPTQAQVDDAQNLAIQANQDLLVEQARINVEQERINDLRTEFEEEQRKINTAQADINTLNTETGKANQAATEALSKVLGINIGGRNLLKKSNLNVSSSAYNIARVYFGDSVPEDGEEITISLKGSLGEGKPSFGFYNSGGNTFIARVPASERDSNGVFKVVTKWKSNSANTYLSIYAMPNSVSATSTVEWVKLERGNTATDWSPAPEEIPSQADLNQSFQDNFERIDDELGLIKSTDQEWKDSQDKVNNALTTATEANTAFSKQQKNLNDLFQEQLWAQLDMIEQLELQSPRVYHQDVDDGPLISNIPSWVGWSNAREYKNTFINFYHRNSNQKMVAWQATGRWEGQVRVTMTWSNGASDVWVYTIHKDRITRGDSSWSGRTFFNSGGAALIYHRNTTFEVYPKHLGRWFNLFWKPEDESWYHSTTALDIRGVEGGPSILRWDTANAKENPGIRLTTSFTCNQPLTLTDMTGKEVTYQAGTTINPQVVDVSKLDKSKQYRFEEVGIHW